MEDRRERPEPELDRLRRQAGEDALEIGRLRAELRRARDHEALIAQLRSEAGVRRAALAEIRETLLSVEMELDDLRAVRDALTPAALEPREGLRLSATFRPSSRRVSGDFYLATEGRDGTSVIVVGDVAGKGPDAAREAAFLRTAFLTIAPFSDDPVQLLRWVNTSYAEGAADYQHFATAICVNYEPGSRRARWARAGHPPPVSLYSGEELLDGAHGMPLGSDQSRVREPGTVELAPGGGLLLYTDGLTEARAGAEQFGAARVGEVVRAMADAPGDELLAQLERSAEEFGGGELGDDLCVIAVQADG